MDNAKIDASLDLAIQLPEEERSKSEALSTGFTERTGTWEVILRIAGEVQRLRDAFPQASFTELSGGYVIGVIPQELLTAVADNPIVIYMEQPKRLDAGVAQGIRASCIWPLQQEITPAGILSGRGVFVAIIDSGIDYFHPDFRNDDGTTRIAWLRDDGVTYSAAQINEALAQPSRRQGLRVVPSQDPSGHGTHVAGIAAGNGRESDGSNRGVAYESELIVVKLGNQRPGGFPKTTQLMDAVEFVKDKAMEAGRPVAINISFGNNYGAHTGTSILETYLSQVADQWQMSLVVGTGNEGSTELHRQGRLPQTGTSVQGGNRAAAEEIELAVAAYESSLNLQLWKNYQDQMEILLLAPDGSEVARLSPTVQPQKERVLSYRWQDTNIHIFFGLPAPYTIYQEIYFSFLPRALYIDSGIWKLRLLPREIKNGAYALWLPSGGVLNDTTGFLLPSEDTTMTIPATADKVITVGAYDSRRNQYAAFSGRGYTWDVNQIKPDLVAPGVDITSCRVGGGYTVRSGTSMATPFVTGTAALIMQWGIVNGNDPYAYGEKLKAYLLRGTQRLGQESIPSPKTGWGKLCAADSLPL